MTEQQGAKTLEQYSSDISKQLNYLNKNIQLAEQVVESIQTIKDQNKDIPASVVVGLSKQLGLIKASHQQLQTSFMQLKQLNTVKQEQLTKINNAIKQFGRRIYQVEQRSPTADRFQANYQMSQSDQLKTKNLQSLLQTVNDLRDEKQQEIDRLAKNAKLLNNAAGEFKEVLQQSVEKVDGLIESAQDTKGAVGKVNTNIQQLTKEVKRDHFCWWLLADCVLLAILVMLIIFCFWGVPPQF